MVSIVGTYQNGYVKLDQEYATDNPVKVIITFLESVQSQTPKRLYLSDFSFAESQKMLASCQGSFSDAVVEERNSDR